MVLVSAPLFIFGAPGYYGDDNNMLDALSGNNGITGAFLEWVNEYGIFYRPVGSLLLHTTYSLFGFNDYLMYWLNLAFFLAFVLAIYLSTLQVTSCRSLSVFVTCFFATFPFNPTAILQLSSLYMIVTGACTVILLSKYYGYLSNYRHSLKVHTVFSILWIILLFSYEQVTGLIAAFTTLFFLNMLDRGAITSVRTSIIKSLPLIIATAGFMLVFFLSPSNPKVTTLNELNNISEQVKKTASFDDEISELLTTNTFSENRFIGLTNKINRSVTFLVDNFRYSLNKMVAAKTRGYILMALILGLTLALYFCPVKRSQAPQSIAHMFFGFVWFSSTFCNSFIKLFPPLSLKIFFVFSRLFEQFVCFVIK